MKKILGISLVAILAVSPMMAFASDPVPVTGTQPVAANPVASTNVATASPQYGLKPAANTDGNVASAGYVKGAYNAAIKAINKVDSLKQDKIDANNKLSYELVSGLGTAATTDASAYDAAGTASGVKSTIEGKLDDGASGYDIDAKTLKVQGQSVLTEHQSLSDYAKKTGVVATIKNTKLTQGTVTQGLSGSISGTSSTVATVMTNWDDDTSSSNITAITAVSNGNLATNVSVAAPTITANTVSYSETVNP